MLKQRSRRRPARLDFINNQTLQKITEFLEVVDVVELSIVNKQLNQKINKSSKITIRVLEFKLANTRSMLKVAENGL